MRSIVKADWLFIMQSTLSVNSVDSDGRRTLQPTPACPPPIPHGFPDTWLGWREGWGRGGGRGNQALFKGGAEQSPKPFAGTCSPERDPQGGRER